MNREFRYINTLGLRKLLVVEEKPDAEGKYACTLWCENNGEYCGGGNLTASELDDMLSHYGLHSHKGIFPFTKNLGVKHLILLFDIS